MASAGLPSYGDLFVGRDAEVADVCRMITDGPARLVTLTGPPGIGKTRLAVEAATVCAEQGHGPPCYVDLAPLRDPAAVLREVARALGLRPRDEADLVDQISDVVGRTDRIVVVDNCEHVLDGTADFGRLVARCPGLRFLVTSRERLRLSAEWEYPVPPLAMPSRGDVSDLAGLAANPSIALLVDRARRNTPNFALDLGNAAALAQACVDLEGLPLAIELAAARLRLFTPGELAFRLGRRLDLLTGGRRDVPVRQQALRAAIAWSYDLLTAEERAVFRRLAVFAGTWSPEDACAVCADEAADATVESLLEKNLVRRATGDGQQPAFVLLAGLREFAAERLDAEDETARFRALHAAHYEQVAVHLEATIGNPEERSWWATGLRHEADLLAALGHSREADDRDRALRLVAALGWCWYTRGDVSRAPAVIDATLDWARGVNPSKDDALRAGCLVAGIIAFTRGNLPESDALLREVLDDGAGKRRTAIAQAFLGHVARACGRFEESLVWHECAAAAFAELNNAQGVAWAQHDLGLLARDRGDHDQAAVLLRAALRAFRDLGYAWAVAWSAWGLGTVLCDGGSTDAARPLLGEALQIYRQLDEPRGVAQCFEAIALVAAEAAGYEGAALLLGSAAAQRARLAVAPAVAERRRVERVEKRCEGALGPDAFERLRQVGITMPVEAVAKIATDVAEGRAAAAPSPTPLAELTRRERQVVALVASGRTNRQIGRALGISEKTAEVHLHNVMAKLGVRSRAEVAVWAVANGS